MAGNYPIKDFKANDDEVEHVNISNNPMNDINRRSELGIENRSNNKNPLSNINQDISYQQHGQDTSSTGMQLSSNNQNNGNNNHHLENQDEVDNSENASGDDDEYDEQPGPNSSSKDQKDGNNQRPAHAPPAKASAETAGMLLIADIVGSGILALGYAFVRLGWIFGIIAGVIWLPLNIYAGLLLLEAKLHHKHSFTYAELGAAVMNGSKAAKYIVSFVVYLFILMVLANYLLIMAESLQNVFATTFPNVCKYWFSLISVGLLIPIVQIRTLNSTKILLIINITSLTISILTALSSLFITGVEQSLEANHAKTEVIASDLTFLTFFDGLAIFAFAYSGSILYVEIMSEMKDAVSCDYFRCFISKSFS